MKCRIKKFIKNKSSFGSSQSTEIFVLFYLHLLLNYVLREIQGPVKNGLIYYRATGPKENEEKRSLRSNLLSWERL